MTLFWIFIAVVVVNMVVAAVIMLATNKADFLKEEDMPMLVLASAFCVPLLCCIGYACYWCFNKLK